MASTIDQALAPDCARSTTRPGVSLTDALLLLMSVIRGVNYAEGVARTRAGNAALVLAGALCWSCFTVLLKPFTDRIGLPRISAITMVGGAISLVVAYRFWYHGVRVLEPTRTAVYSNLQPVIALVVAWIALSGVPTLWQGIGAGTIIAGVILTRT